MRTNPATLHRALRYPGVLLLFALLALASARGQYWQRDPGFSPSFEGAQVTYSPAVRLLPGGKMLVTVEYAINGRVREDSWVRLNRDGSLDESFVPLSATGWNILATYPDGRLLGRHTRYDYTQQPAAQIERLVRLLPDGTQDPAFTPVETTIIHGVRILTAGQIVLWGIFERVNGVALRGIALVGADGTVDARFRPPTLLGSDGRPTAVEEAIDGRILVAGTFRPSDPTRPVIEGVRLMALDGALDPAFGVQSRAGSVYRLYPQPDGFLLAAGSVGLVRIEADGSRDPDYRPRLTGTPTGFSERQPDGTIFYLSRAETGGNSLRRLRGDGTPDAAWQMPTPSSSDRYNGLFPACAADGTLVMGTPFQSERGAHRLALTRYGPGGDWDQTFNPRFSRLASPNSFVWHPDGSAWVSGTFYRANGAETGTARVLLRLTSDGSTDETFRPELGQGEQVTTLRVLADGRVLAFGTFTAGGATVSVVRFLSDGSRDPSYRSPRLATTAGAANTVDETGRFHVMTSTAATSVARYLPSGDLDPAFSGAQLEDRLSLVTALGDGSVLAISTPARAPARMVKFRADGSLEASFTPDAAVVPGDVVAMTGLPDGRAIVAAEPPGGRLRLFRMTSAGIVDYAYHLPAAGLAPEERTLRVAGVLYDLLRMADATSAQVVRVAIPATNQSLAPAVWGDGRVASANARFYRRTPAAGPSADPRPLVAEWTSEREVFRAVGGEFTLSAGFAGLYPMRFQLRKGGALVAESTESVFTRRNLSADDAGAYTITAINDHGTATTEAVRLDINPTAGALAAIQQHPRSQTISTGGDVTFTVVASGSPAPKYQWLFNGRYISGEQGSTLTLRRVHPEQAGSYSVLVENEVEGRFTWKAQVTSNPAALTVGVPFRGVYFGSFAQGDAAGMQIALAVAADGSAVLLGDLAARRIALVGSRGLQLDSEGAMAGLVEAMPSAGVSRPLSLQLRVDIQGRVEGAVSGMGSFTAARVPDNDTALSGYFRAEGVTGEEGLAHIILGSDGRALVVLVRGESFASGSGRLDRDGRLPQAGAEALRIAADLGTQQVQLAVEEGAASTAFSGRRYAGLLAGVTSQGRLANVSMRGRVEGLASPLIAGFVVAGDRPQTVLVRAAGPSLEPLGVSGVLAAPRLAIHRASVKLDEGGAWGREFGRHRIAAAAARAGAFPFALDSLDAAKLLTLAPGAYTAQVTGEGARGGIALLEVYAVRESETMSASAGLLNVSARAAAGIGEGGLIAGFVVEGTASRRLLVRGAGPALAAFGVEGALANPTIALLAGSRTLAANDDWGAGSSAESVRASAARVGAFPFPAGSRDAALLVALQPGAYTAQVSGSDARGGVALVEVYEVDP